MSLDLCILASGSAGNCAAVRSPGGLLLLDCGIGPNTTARRLADAGGARMDDVAGVCLTHLDRDHLAAAFLTWLGRKKLPIYCHRSKEHALRWIAERQQVKLDVRCFGDEPFEPLTGLAVDPIALAHDAEGSHGFVLSSSGGDRGGKAGASGGRIGYATDLGRVPDGLVDRFCAADGLDVLAIESNYCPQMQLASPRPAFLKQRIMGGSGHLSNAQAFDAVRQVFNGHGKRGLEPPGRVVLLHRSQQCNCPERVREVFARDGRIGSRLVLAEQREPTGWLRSPVRRAKQMEFGWG